MIDPRPVPFRLQEVAVGGPDQVIEAGRHPRSHRGAAIAGGHPDLVTIRRCELDLDTLQPREDRREVLRIGERKDRDELVTSPATDHIELTELLVKGVRVRTQHLITGVMTVGIVDGLEVVQVREDDRDQVVGFPCVGEQPEIPVLSSRPGQQGSEVVVMSQTLKVGLPVPPQQSEVERALHGCGGDQILLVEEVVGTCLHTRGTMTITRRHSDDRHVDHDPA